MDGKLVVKRGRKRATIHFDDIIFMEKEQRKINIFTREDVLTIYGRYHEVESSLDERFTSPHRSYMLNMNHITMMDENRVIMETGQEINLCRTCMDRLKKTYDKYVAKNLANP